MICTNWICRICRGVIRTTLECRSCGTRYALAELQYEWLPRKNARTRGLDAENRESARNHAKLLRELPA